MTFDHFSDWFFTWPVLVLAIAFVAAMRIWHDWAIDRHQDQDDE
jgi:bacteriorhodopsin